MKQLIAITRPEIFAEEAPLLETLFEKGLERLHIRKPQSEAKEVEKLLMAINPAYYPRIALHDHFELADDYGLGGVHLNSRNPQAPPHSKEESADHAIRSRSWRPIHSWIISF